jgi:hypothetical protein
MCTGEFAIFKILPPDKTNPQPTLTLSGTS